MRQKKSWFTISGILAALAIAVVLTPNAVAGSVYRVLYKFKGGNDGGHPFAGLIFDAAGNLYGTTLEGGGDKLGTAFKLAPNLDGSWTESVLYRFAGGSDGEFPFARLIFDAVGNLYGTTQRGGSTNCSGGCGTVFRLAPNPDGTWTESVLYRFLGRSDGDFPDARLTFDTIGNLYGTTFGGGFSGGGVVFKLRPASNGKWRESVLHSFNGPDGDFPAAGLIFDRAGNLYGSTQMGGDPNCGNTFGCGVIFRLSPKTNGGWKHQVLYAFAGGKDGGNPTAGLTLDTAGNLYGTTSGTDANLYSTVFKLAPRPHGSWKETVLHRFCSYTNCRDGSGSFADLTFDAVGNLYGNTFSGGGMGDGVVFKLEPESRGRWKYSVVHSFRANPAAGADGSLIFDKTGKLFGTTAYCARSEKCRGVVYEVTP